MKKFLSLMLIFVLAFSMPVQAAVKKITAEECKGEAGCLIFTAPKTGTYKFTIKNSTTSSILVGTSKGSPLNDSPENLNLGRRKNYQGPYSGKLQFMKGDSVYVTLSQADLETGNYRNGKVTLIIKKIKNKSIIRMIKHTRILSA